jgi:hypothetical protein
MRRAALASLVTTLALVVGQAASASAGHAKARAPDCGPMDVVYVIDDTGSMSGAIASVQAQASNQVRRIRLASHNDYQLGLVTFKDTIQVDDDLASGNGPAVVEDILTLSANGGSGEPEASDESLNTVVNGLDEIDREPGQQFGDFDGHFRPEATKIVILITDAHPGGFDDRFTPGVDDANAHQRAMEAALAGIQIGAIFVPTEGSDSTIIAIMRDYAATSNGLYLKTTQNGSNTAEAIGLILLTICSGS